MGSRKPTVAEQSLGELEFVLAEVTTVQRRLVSTGLAPNLAAAEHLRRVRLDLSDAIASLRRSTAP